MNAWIERSAQRLFIAGGLALAVGIPTLVCGGADVEEGGDEAGGDKDAPDEATPESKIIGTWQIRPPQELLRQLMIIDSALDSKNEKKLKKLKKLKPDEEKLWEEWKKKKGTPDADLMKAQMKFMKQCKLTFTDSKATVNFGKDESFGPVSYKIKSATDSKMVLEFDPGLGNGMETHSITWKSDKKGTNQISSSKGDFNPFEIARVGG